MKIISTSLKKIRRNTLRNKSYRSQLKTYKTRYFSYIQKHLLERNTDYLPLIIKNLNLSYSILDKSKNLNILNKRTVARKKSKLQQAFNFFLTNNNGQ